MQGEASTITTTTASHANSTMSDSKESILGRGSRDGGAAADSCSTSETVMTNTMSRTNKSTEELDGIVSVLKPTPLTTSEERTVANQQPMQEENGNVTIILENTEETTIQNETNPLLSSSSSLYHSTSPSTTSRKRWFSKQNIRVSTTDNSVNLPEKSASFLRRKKVWSFLRQRVKSFVVHDHDHIHLNSNTTNTTPSPEAEPQNHKEEEQQPHDLLTTVDQAMNATNFQFHECALAILLYLFLGVLAYSYLFESWSFVNALYFSVVTFTTVGYGDLYPTTTYGRLFNGFFALGGIAFLGIVLGVIGNELVEAQAMALDKARRVQQEEVVGCVEWSEEAAARDSILLQNQTLPNNKSTGTPEEQECGSMQNMLEALSDANHPFVAFLTAFLIILLGSLLMSFLEGWSYGQTLYYIIITASTVGYGDIAPSTPAGRGCCVVFIPLAVGVVGVVLGKVASTMMEDRREAALNRITTSRITVEDLHSIDSDKSGTVSRKEFVDFMLIRMNLVDPECLKKIHEQFDLFDIDNNEYIQKSDLIERAKQRNQDVRYKLELAAYKDKLCEKLRKERAEEEGKKKKLAEMEGRLQKEEEEL